MRIFILKNRLSEILQSTDDASNGFLERIEYFQNGFLEKDKVISVVRTDLSEHSKLLTRDMHKDSESLKEVKENQEKLRKDLETDERKFSKLKFVFNNCLRQIL